jgi:hypothetical protein
MPWRRQGAYFRKDLEEVECEYVNLINGLKGTVKLYVCVFVVMRKLH